MTIDTLSHQLDVEKTALGGVLLITPNTIFDDFRGDYVEIYHESLYKNSGITEHFVQDDYATSSKHVLRGIHGDNLTAKLVKCIFGSIYLIVVNNIPTSSEYKKWLSFSISSINRKQVFIPKGFGIGYLVMSETAVFHYKQSSYYGEAKQFTIKWNDPKFNFWWPLKNPIVSMRDYE